MLDAEEGQAGIQSPFEVGGFQAGFVAVAFDRCQGRTVDVLVGLRLVDAGVAGVGRVGVVQVIDHTGIRRDHAMLLVAGMGVIESRTRIVRIVFVVLEGAQAAAEDDRQVIGRV
ncbi:hypothetical protein D3C84_1040310 [compost metagenome]